MGCPGLEVSSDKGLWLSSAPGDCGHSMGHMRPSRPLGLTHNSLTLVSSRSGFFPCSHLWGPLRYPGQADRRPSSARLPSCHSWVDNPARAQGCLLPLPVQISPNKNQATPSDEGFRLVYSGKKWVSQGQVAWAGARLPCRPLRTVCHVFSWAGRPRPRHQQVFPVTLGGLFTPE